MSALQDKFSVPANSILYTEEDAKEPVDLNIVEWQRLIADRIKEQIDAHYVDTADQGFRSHLGWSVIGNACIRYLYYHWHWFAQESPAPRYERIFMDGHRIEAEIRHILQQRGAQFLDTVDVDGKQIKVSDLLGHFGGSCDGVFVWPEVGLVEPTLLECKSSGTGSKFNDLAKHTVMSAKPQHYRQMCGYGRSLGLRHGLYVCKNKNDASLYTEIVPLSWEQAEQDTKTAQFIIFGNELPLRISTKPSYYLCKMCEAHSVCHMEGTPRPNCRNCRNCRPIDDGQFHCEQWNAVIPKEHLINGCPNHQFLPY